MSLVNEGENEVSKRWGFIRKKADMAIKSFLGNFLRKDIGIPLFSRKNQLWTDVIKFHKPNK